MQIFKRIKTEKRCTMETCAFGGNVRKIQGLYERNIKMDGYISTLNKFGLYGGTLILWVGARDDSSLETTATPVFFINDTLPLKNVL